MSKGIFYLAPGQHEELVTGIQNRDYRVIVDSDLKVDGEFGTPVGKAVKMEFKTVPDDLVSSIRNSGRMSRQMIELGANDGPSILFEVGYPQYDWHFDQLTGKRHYEMINPKYKRGHPHYFTGLTYGELMLRQLTLAMIGVWPVVVPGWEVMPETVCEFYSLFQSKEHRSHLLRPNFVSGNKMEAWEKPSLSDLMLHVFQGFDDVGLVKAKNLWKTFGDFATFAIAGSQDPKFLRMAPGIGQKAAESIHRQLNAPWADYEKEQNRRKK